jgi:hypothetical protein
MPVLYKKQLYAFGDYVAAYDGTDNTAWAHSVPCIALHCLFYFMWKEE